MASDTSTSSLAGKTALITGGSRGIGAAIAYQFAKKGISGIAVTYANSKEAAESVLSKCRDLGVKKTVAIHANLLDEELGANLIPKVLEGLDTKTLDIVVNNAAVMDFTLLEPFDKITLRGVRDFMQGHIWGMISIVQATLPHFPPKGGRVINISSIAGKVGNPDPMMVYGASKAAMDSITRSLAETCAIKTSATFNSVTVGGTLTETLQALIDQEPIIKQQSIEDSSAEARMGEPEDIAYVVGFLASEEGRWINGAAVAANGGCRRTMALQG